MDKGLGARIAALAVIGIAVSVGLILADVPVILPRSDTTFVAYETSATLVMALVAFLTVGRFLRRRTLADALLVAAFTTLASVGVLTLTPPLLDGGSGWSPGAWQQSLLRGLAAALLAAAAWLPMRPRHALRRPWPAVVWMVATPLGVLLLVGLLARALPLPPFASLSGAAVTLSPSATLLKLGSAVLLVVAAVGLITQHREHGDPFVAWLVVSVLAFALAHANHVVEPTVIGPDLHVGDAFRLLGALLLLFGALTEIGASWRSYAELALVDERRRMARELHDGVAQELSYLLTAVRSLDVGARQAPEVHEIETAAARALDETRVAISASTRLPDEPVAAVLEAFAVQVARRHGGEVSVRCHDDGPLPDETLLTLGRIVREAVTNAMVHGHAGAVVLELDRGPTNRLRVRDDGDGFDPLQVHERGFGLTSMAERATLLGGRLQVDSAPGAGTVVEVEW